MMYGGLYQDTLVDCTFISTFKQFYIVFFYKYFIINRLLGIQLQQVACAYGNPDCVSDARAEFDRWRNGTQEELVINNNSNLLITRKKYTYYITIHKKLQNWKYKHVIL